MVNKGVISLASSNTSILERSELALNCVRNYKTDTPKHRRVYTLIGREYPLIEKAHKVDVGGSHEDMIGNL